MSDEDEYQDDAVKPRRGAPKGNQFWKARTKHGRDKLFASADLLWESCCEYFQWVEDNPLWEDKVTQYQGGVVDLPVCKMRAMTIGGLCIFLDMTIETWTQWRKDKDFSEVVKRAEAVIYEQKFTGAAADLLNPNIIARDLGLRDDSRQEITGKDGGAIEVEMSERDKARRVAFLLAKAARNKEQK